MGEEENSNVLDSSSILNSIKKLLGISPHDDGFDQEVKDLINAEFLTLHQLSVGPEGGFSIEGPEDVWSDFTNNLHLQDAVRQFVYLRVRLIFDPPASSTVAEQINNKISELEFRLNIQAEEDTEES